MSVFKFLIQLFSLFSMGLLLANCSDQPEAKFQRIVVKETPSPDNLFKAVIEQVNVLNTSKNYPPYYEIFVSGENVKESHIISYGLKKLPEFEWKTNNLLNIQYSSGSIEHFNACFNESNHTCKVKLNLTFLPTDKNELNISPYPETKLSIGEIIGNYLGKMLAHSIVANDELLRVTSPDQLNDAVLIRSNGGAGSSYAYLLYIVRKNSKIYENQNMVAYDLSTLPSIEWSDSHNLLICNKSGFISDFQDIVWQGDHPNIRLHLINDSGNQTRL